MINLKEIILLDDNDDTNYYNQDIVEETNLFTDILVFTDPNKVLELVKSRLENGQALPGVFLVDINMPFMDGFEFLDELDMMTGEENELPRVYILSTSSHKRDKEQFDRSFLAKGYINKPLMVENLIELFK